MSSESKSSSSSESKPSRNEFDAKPIPLNGTRVPTGMTDHADWQSLPEQPVVTVPSATYGAEYVRIETRRNALGELKKCISNLVLPLSAINKNNALLSTITDTEAEADRVSTVREFLVKDEQQKQAALTALKGQMNTFEGDTIYSEVINKLVTDAERELTVIEWNKLNEWIKIQTTTIFREQGNFLQELKKIKKEFATKGKDSKKEE